MNIIWITKLSDSTPFKSTQFGITKALRKKGHQVHLYLVKPAHRHTPSDQTHTYLPILDAPLISGFILGMYLLTYFPLMINRKHIDVVIIDGDQILSPFCFILRMMKPPVIWDIRSLPIDRSKSFLHDLSFYLSDLFVDALTTITPELKETLIETYHLRKKPIGLWSSAVSPEIFTTQIDNSGINTRDQNSSFTLIYHGTYSPTRGIEELITSISHLPQTIRPLIKLRIVGICV
jgi:glycosyltransferase involved in cell wall biosynthesis